VDGVYWKKQAFEIVVEIENEIEIGIGIGIGIVSKSHSVEPSVLIGEITRCSSECEVTKEMIQVGVSVVIFLVQLLTEALLKRREKKEK
jgi:hypothetical protein